MCVRALHCSHIESTIRIYNILAYLQLRNLQQTLDSQTDVRQTSSWQFIIYMYMKIHILQYINFMHQTDVVGKKRQATCRAPQQSSTARNRLCLLKYYITLCYVLFLNICHTFAHRLPYTLHRTMQAIHTYTKSNI